MCARAIDQLPMFPAKMTSQDFVDKKYEHYRWMHREAPLCRGKFFMMRPLLLASYDDCKAILKDPRFVRNRATATGGRAFPFPLPRVVKLLMKGLIQQDNPTHKRQRSLVSKAFTPRGLAQLKARVVEVTDQHLDAIVGRRVDLIETFCLPLPTTIIQEMLGARPEDMPAFQKGLTALTEGMSGLTMVRTFAWEVPRLVKLIERMIQDKRENPGDDLLTGLVLAEEDGERLSHDELIAMTFTLIIAGYETTVHLLSNTVITLLDHPDQLALLREDPSLIDSAIEEVLRFKGPIHGTKPMFASEDIEFKGVLIPRSTGVFPLLGAANRDPDQFDDPETFDIQRTPNRHLGFGFGPHHCLGAALARMETRVAIARLLERSPSIEFDAPRSSLKLQKIPMWHRYAALPISLGR